MSEDSWIDVAATRLALIEQLKAEKRQLQSEIDRLNKRAPVPETVTRVTVVKDSRVIAEVFAGSWRSFLQDDGRTVKLFGKGSGAKASAERGIALGEELTRRQYCSGCGGAFAGWHDCGRKR